MIRTASRAEISQGMAHLPDEPCISRMLLCQNIAACKVELSTHREGLRGEASWTPGPSGSYQQQEARLGPLPVGRHEQAPCEGRPWALLASRRHLQVLHGRLEALHRLPPASVFRCPRGHVAPPCVPLAASGASPLSTPCTTVEHA